MPQDFQTTIERRSGHSLGQVWCRTCERGPVPVDNGLVNGWPKCCGQTMTIDPPHTWNWTPEDWENSRRPQADGKDVKDG